MNQVIQILQDRTRKIFPYILISIMTLIVFGLGIESVMPNQYAIRVNEVAPTTIRAPYTVIDQKRTDENKTWARDSVADIYAYQAAIREEQLKVLEDYFGLIREMRKGSYSSAILLEWVEGLEGFENLKVTLEGHQRPKTRQVAFSQLSQEEQLLVLKHQIQSSSKGVQTFVQDVEDEMHASLMALSDEEIVTIQSSLVNQLSQTLSQEITGEEVSKIIEPESAKLDTTLANEMSRTIAKAFLDQLIVPTMVYDDSATKAAKEEAVNQVQATYILQGQVIVQEGFIVDSEMIRLLNIYNILDTTPVLYPVILFSFVLVVHGLMLLSIYKGWLEHSKIGVVATNRRLVAYCGGFLFSFIVLILLAMLVSQGVSNALLLFPAGLLPFLLNQKTDRKSLIFAIIFFNLIGLLVLNNHPTYSNVLFTMFYYVLSMLFTMFRLDENKEDMPSLWSTLLGQLFIAIPILMALQYDFLDRSTYQTLFYMLSALVISYIIYFFIRPYWDQFFDDKAELTLNQLANLNHPLLKQLIEEAPGTYHHSILVSNLSANAVEVIGGDSQFTRVAAYYHDVGKIKHPLFFVENLPGGMVSPHQMVSPKESAKIIIDHVHDGVEILQAYKMPQAIIDICLQHHGTTQVSYFYHQEKKDHPDTAIQDFTYPGPKPQTKEAAVIMISDSVEAASRSLKEHTYEAIEDLVDKIVENKILTHQFSECDLTVHELNLVKTSLVRGLAGMFHTRIEYPD